MTPTLLGSHRECRCHDCGIRWPVHGLDVPANRSDVLCFHCGGRAEPGPSRPGDLVSVEIERNSHWSPAVGEGVAIQGASGLRVKRVVAIAGQSLSVDRGWLMRDGQPLDAGAPWMLVHDDRFRRGGQSRWQVETGKSPTWRSRPGGFGASVKQDQPSGWLVYGHRDVYQRVPGTAEDPPPGRIRDDYPGSVTERRWMRPIDTIRLGFIAWADQPSRLEVAFWSSAGIVTRSITCSPGENPVSVDNASRRPSFPALSDASDAGVKAADARPPVTPTHPLALRLMEGQIRINDLKIFRPIAYWIAAEDEITAVWPLTIPPGHVYVIGDNVPWSIDSRQQGPIPTSRILGRVRLCEPSTNVVLREPGERSDPP